MPPPDERVLSGKHRTVGYLGPWSSSFTLVWLATHRKRLHTLLFGGKRLSILVVWDSEGDKEVRHSDAELEAIRAIMHPIVEGGGA